MFHTPELSVIVTTYNQPAWLEHVLTGYACQTFRSFEVIVADDGSTEETSKAIESASLRYGFSMRHLWQRDRGFRKCRILNKAIMKAKADYLVFTDGDCIPRKDFLAVHAATRKAGTFLSGGYVKLPEAPSRAIDGGAIRRGDHCRYGWLRQHGLDCMQNVRKLCAGGRIAQWMNHFSGVRAGWHGHNSSCWKSDALAVKGFDERMGWGGEDREFGYRLVNHGVTPQRVRYTAICVHLDHSRPWKDEAVLAKNDAIREETRRVRKTTTEYGIP